MDSSSNNDAASGSSSVNAETSFVNLQEVLAEQAEMEAESDAVLGGSDDKNCTYSQGYIGRQALYSCLTCIPESRTEEDKRAGVCLACSYRCHEGHEMVELYTKRNFRCDCGSKRMPQIRCALEPFKFEANDLNQYNQNFSGTYCTCHRPYPDPEDKIPDEMIQCVVCEDWYHTRHLQGKLPESKEFAEMICDGCMEKIPVLAHYVGKIEDANSTLLNETVQVDVTGLDESTTTTAVSTTTSVSSIAEDTASDANESKRLKLDICTKPPLDDEESPAKVQATFWNEGWRQHLCRCTSCMEIYSSLKVEFLLDEKDTVQWYEENGRIKSENQAEQDMEALSKLDRVQQIEFLSGYNLLKERMKEFLDGFVDTQQVITEQDIKEFFARVTKERKDSKAMPTYFCR
ncbi:putative E3 ubiquitin-protein ligase UBR7 [Uranotaenia lowii]|uniref:putative E3 ubiquitin-protein ligase UBR7 n=1 Tax=Uranotaenia lowii TaxID=190385 RepID=UPI00247A62F8|nr:putative E3 ubiquitin-protein ligase UBR7 [Uranotaenia lowii]